MRASVRITVLALLLPALAAALPGDALGPLAFPCDTPTPGLPCNLRMTFAPNNGNENYIAINPTNPNNFVSTSKDYGLTGQPGVHACNVNNVWTGYYTTLDGGQTWTNGYARGHPGSSATPISKYKCSTDATIAVDNAGTFYLSGLAYNSTAGTSAVWVAKSTDGGITFSDPRIGDESNFDDKNWIAVDPDTSDVYITWTQFNTGSGIKFRRALAGDIGTWGPRLQLSGASSGSAQGSFPLVAPDGTVHVFWNDNIQGGSGSMYVAKSTDHGASFSAERAIFTYTAANWNGDAEYRTPTIPHAAVDRSNGPHRGTLYVVYQGLAHGDPDAFIRRSTDGGLTWSAEKRLNDDVIGNDKGQNFPTIAVDPSNGWVHVIWEDRRDDPNNRLFGTYYTVSKDGGLTWSKNQRVSTHLSDPSPCKHQGGFTFIGDYWGIAAAGGKARPSFVDTRNGRCDLYTALLFAGPQLKGNARPHANLSQPESITLTAAPFTPLDSARLEVDVPLDWTLGDLDGGVVVPGAGLNTVRWDFGAIGSDRSVTFTATPTKARIVDLQARLDWSLTSEASASGRERWNATVLVSYPVLYLDLTVPRTIGTASAYNATVRIDNVGYGAATNATLEFIAPNGTIPVPRGGDVTVEPLALGLTYGKPPSDPTALGLLRIVWTLPSVEPQSTETYRLVLLSPAAQQLAPSPNMVHSATLRGTAPDGAALRTAESETTRLTGLTTSSVLASPGVLVEYVGP